MVLYVIVCRSRSKSGRSGSERSRSPSASRQDAAQDSRSNSPRLEIDAGSPTSEHGDKRKRESSAESEIKKRKRIISDSGSDEGKEVLCCNCNKRF